MVSASGEIRRAKDGGKNNWRTPRALFDCLNDEYAFTLDGAADAENALCARFYSEADNAFSQNPEGEVIWVNPPYGGAENACQSPCKKKRCPKRGYCVSEYQPGLEDWTELFIRWSAKNQVVVLVPTATDTEWFAKAFRAAKDVTFLAARVQFVNPETGQPDPGNTTGSVIFRFNSGIGCDQCPHVTLWDWRKDLL